LKTKDPTPEASWTSKQATQPNLLVKSQQLSSLTEKLEVNLKCEHLIPTVFCYPDILALLEVGANSNRKHSTRTNDGIPAVTKMFTKPQHPGKLLCTVACTSFHRFPVVKVSKMHSFHDIGHAWLFVSFILGIRD